MLALGMIAALAMPGTAQATPQLGDLGVKQSMSVKASNGESLEGKDLRAIQLATYTAASVDGNTIVGYDLTTNTALASDITAAAKAAGATDTNLTVNGKNDPMVWVVKNLTDSRSDPWSGKLRNFCNSLAKQTNFAKQDGTAVSTLSQDKATMSTGNVLVPGIYAIVDRTPATTTLSSGTAIKTTASIMMMNGTAVNGVNQLRTAGGTTLTLGQVIYKVSNVESPDKKVNVGSAWKDSASEAIGKDLTYRVTQKIPNWTGYEHYYLALNDTLGAGLDYGSLTSITVGGKALASTFYKENVNGKTISWLFGVNGDILASDASKAALPVGATITVTYKARLNGNAVIGSPCNVNSIDLEYSHNPNAWQDHNNQPGNEVKVCTGEIALRKVDAKSQKLTGAKFAIAQGASDQNAFETRGPRQRHLPPRHQRRYHHNHHIRSRRTKIQGLKGEYTITETQAPQDYSSLMLPSAVVTVNVDDTNMTWSLDVKSDPNNLIKKGDSHTVVVTNIRTITEIPLTGAAGLTMLFSIAALLFIGGIVMLRMCDQATTSQHPTIGNTWRFPRIANHGTKKRPTNAASSDGAWEPPCSPQRHSSSASP